MVLGWGLSHGEVGFWQPLALGAEADLAASQLSALLDELWEYDLRESPLFATDVGDPRYNDLLPDASLAAIERRHQQEQAFLNRLESVDRSQLSIDDQISYDVVLRRLREDATEYAFQSHLVPITSRSGFHVEFPELRREVPLNTTRDYENYIARLRAFDRYAEDYIERMRAVCRPPTRCRRWCCRGTSHRSWLIWSTIQRRVCGTNRL